MIADLIPAPYRWLAWLVVAAVIAGAGAWGGHALTRDYYAPRLTAADARANQLEAAYRQLASVTESQNAAVTALQAAADRRQREAATAVADAHQAAEADRTAAAGVLGLKLPAGADACHQADALAAQAIAQWWPVSVGEGGVK